MKPDPGAGWSALFDELDTDAPPPPPGPEPPRALPRPTAAAPVPLFDTSTPPDEPLRLLSAVEAPSSPAPKPEELETRTGRRALITIGVALAVFAAVLWMHEPVELVKDLGPGQPRVAPRVAAPTPPPAAPEAEAPVTAARPMLSVMTRPAGAQVEIGGVVYGRTPLVIESPDSTSLMLTLRAEGCRIWTEVVRPDPTGHYTVNVKLERLPELTPPEPPRHRRPARRR